MAGHRPSSWPTHLDLVRHQSITAKPLTDLSLQSLSHANSKYHQHKITPHLLQIRRYNLPITHYLISIIYYLIMIMP
jgi:hypothetical protein